MAKRSKRQKAIKRLNLSDHTLDINIRKCNYNKFNFSDIEDYVNELVGSRDYQYDAIKQSMIYLWGNGYKSITELGKENHLEELKKLQDEGIETLIKVVEIKSDEEQDEATPAKEEYAKAHFERVNEKLGTLNLADLEGQYRGDAKQYYTFDLLTPISSTDGLTI